MEVRIGIHQSPREITIETQESQDRVRQAVNEAFAAGDAALLTLSDAKNNEYLIPVKNITYIEFSGTETRRVGFVS